ncbi:hypothetical protein F383_32275 [Gossypium arboreum]|uniref:Uncharacterized protein n=1 Tax=Gossypium arboreum TaxID=29729 RepID=A0A0B0PRA9_GOSAR|nr:hypothetical protein F383_32275 [Gossypium arboreum]
MCGAWWPRLRGLVAEKF